MSTDPPVPHTVDPATHEQSFRKFMRQLLDAQGYSFLYDRNLFSPHTLQRILIEFCNIIAADLDAESCTVHLQLYSRGSYELRDDVAEAHLMRLADAYELKETGADGSPRKRFLERRRCWMDSAMTFPYWRFPKGAAKLVAANRTGPWKAHVRPFESADPEAGVTDSAGPEIGIARLNEGISKDVVQGKRAKVRDRRDIRATRHQRKLGAVDGRVWTNTDWTHVFRNYYGVPIQIHPDGEVLGILKVENKKDYAGNDSRKAGAIQYLDGAKGVGALVRKLVALADEEWEKGADQEFPYSKCPVSLAALAYLEDDLKNAPRDKRLSDLVFIPWQSVNPPRMTPAVRTLIPRQNDRPPVQLLFDSLDAERTTWQLMFPKSSHTAYDAYAAVKALYGSLTDTLRTINVARDCAAALRKFFMCFNEAGSGLTVKARCASPNEGYPDFCHHVTIGDENSASAHFLVIHPPSPKELKAKTFARAERLRADAYRYVNAKWAYSQRTLPKALKRTLARALKAYRRENNGEYCQFVPESHDAKPLRVTNLLLDRWAARTQAFIESVPIKPFTLEDTHKLSWAALEIGKLIEREIAYRANHFREPMPLTATEFYRIPISDFSFVDDLHRRRSDTARCKTVVDYNLGTLVDNLSMSQHIDYSSRIKPQRSFLARLGERHEGYIRGNLALWFYLLSYLADVRPSPELGTNRAFTTALTLFRERVTAAARLAKVQGFNGQSKGNHAAAPLHDIETFLKNLGRKNLLADLKFDSFPFQCDGDITA